MFRHRSAANGKMVSPDFPEDVTHIHCYILWSVLDQPAAYLDFLHMVRLLTILFCMFEEFLLNPGVNMSELDAEWICRLWAT